MDLNLLAQFNKKWLIELLKNYSIDDQNLNDIPEFNPFHCLLPWQWSNNSHYSGCIHSITLIPCSGKCEPRSDQNIHISEFQQPNIPLSHLCSHIEKCGRSSCKSSDLTSSSWKTSLGFSGLERLPLPPLPTSLQSSGYVVRYILSLWDDTIVMKFPLSLSLHSVSIDCNFCVTSFVLICTVINLWMLNLEKKKKKGGLGERGGLLMFVIGLIMVFCLVEFT